MIHIFDVGIPKLVRPMSLFATRCDIISPFDMLNITNAVVEGPLRASPVLQTFAAELPFPIAKLLLLLETKAPLVRSLESFIRSLSVRALPGTSVLYLSLIQMATAAAYPPGALTRMPFSAANEAIGALPMARLATRALFPLHPT